MENYKHLLIPKPLWLEWKRICEVNCENPKEQILQHMRIIIKLDKEDKEIKENG